MNYLFKTLLVQSIAVNIKGQKTINFAKRSNKVKTMKTSTVSNAKAKLTRAKKKSSSTEKWTQDSASP